MTCRSTAPRTGAIVPLMAILIVFLLGMVAFAVDLGYIAVVQKEMQNAADAAAMAGASQLLDRGALAGIPNQFATATAARDQAQKFSSLNTAGGTALALSRNDANSADGDIVLGYISNPRDMNSPFNTTATTYNSCRVRPRRVAAQNGSLRLFFGAVLGHGTQDLSATATATYEGAIQGFAMSWAGAPNPKLLPFAYDVNKWRGIFDGTNPDAVDQWTYNPVTRAYAKGTDGIKEVNLYPAKGNAPGNFGTVDIGPANNSTADLSRQILYGPNKADLDAIGGACALGPNGYINLNGDTGISAGVKDDLAAIRGQPRIIPLFEPPVTGNGNNATYKIVGFAGVVVLDVQLTGGNKYVTIQPEYVQDPTALGGGSSSTSSFVTKPLKLTR